MSKLDELGMFDEFSLRGRWYLPASPNDVVAGELKFSQSRLRLTLDQCFESMQAEPFSLKSEPFRVPVMFGVATTGEQVTLKRNVVLRMGDDCEFASNELLVGVHIAEDAEGQVQAVLGELTHLGEWAYVPQFKIVHVAGEKRTAISVPEGSVDILCVDSVPPFKRITLSSGVEHHYMRKNIQLKVRSTLKSEFDPFVSISEARRAFDLLPNLFSLLVGEAVLTKKLRIIIRKDSSRVPVDVFVPLRPPRFRIEDFDDMAIPLGEMSDEAPVLISRWITEELKLRPVYNLLLSTIHRPDQYVQSSFLSLAQGLESFHRIIFPGRYVEEEEYSKIKKVLLEAVPAGTSADLKIKLDMALKHANQFSLRKRLRELLETLGSVSADKFFGQEHKSDFVSMVVDVRNYLTHFDESSTPGIVSVANDTIRLYNLKQRLRALLTALLLQHLGLSDRIVSRLFTERNLDLAREP